MTTVTATVRDSKRVPTHDTASSQHEWDGVASGNGVYEDYPNSMSASVCYRYRGTETHK